LLIHEQKFAVSGMRGGVVLFRGSGADAMRYLESDRSTADEYYLGPDALARFAVVDVDGEMRDEDVLSQEQYRDWVDWVDPITGERMGTPRDAVEDRLGSPRFAELVVNVPKSLSVAAALDEEISDALDDAVAEIRRFLGQHSVTRIGPRGEQEVVPVEALKTVAVRHKTSRAGDPHRHIHLQIGTRVWARDGWRGLDTKALFAQQGAIRALGTAVLAAHPKLAAVLAVHGLTLDPVSGEVVELQPFNTVLSKRAEQVTRNLDRFVAEWRAARPGEEPSRRNLARLHQMVWDHERPHKRPARLGPEGTWLGKLRAAGFDPVALHGQVQIDVHSLDELSIETLAHRALDRCASAASIWHEHAVREQVTRLVTEAGVRAEPADLRLFIQIATELAVTDCLSVLPPDAPKPEHVAHLTSLRVIAADTELRDRLAAPGGTGGADPAERLSPPRDEAPTDRARAPVRWAARRRPRDRLDRSARRRRRRRRRLRQDHDARRRDRREPVRRTPYPDRHPNEAGRPRRPGSAERARDVSRGLLHANGFRWDTDGVWTRLTPATPTRRPGGCGPVRTGPRSSPGMRGASSTKPARTSPSSAIARSCPQSAAAGYSASRSRPGAWSTSSTRSTVSPTPPRACPVSGRRGCC